LPPVSGKTGGVGKHPIYQPTALQVSLKSGKISSLLKRIPHHFNCHYKTGGRIYSSINIITLQDK
ncbi:MAG: hypothetical protein ACQERI_11140, partial [Candidatus Krumholzibacteriota bacterium]